MDLLVRKPDPTRPVLSHVIYKIGWMKDALEAILHSIDRRAHAAYILLLQVQYKIG